MSQPVLLTGTLCDPDLFAIVTGEACVGREASLQEQANRTVGGASIAPPTKSDIGTASGLLTPLERQALARLDYYAAVLGFRTETRDVLTSDGSVPAKVYLPNVRHLHDDPRSMQTWRANHAELERLAAREVMALMTTHSTADVARAYPQIRMRAASRLRAGAEPSPDVLEPSIAHRGISLQKTRQPYTDYFAVREDWISFPKFSGGISPAVKRASFLSGDAVTVLPFDPDTDHVLMVRQFRHGAFARGDSNPWTLEPAAGRIDPGEVPEETAARELFEETGVTAQSLHLVGRYYPSPGAYSEYLYSYVGLADLTGTDGGVGGLEDETEDILRHAIPFAQAMKMIETGAINTAPLILSLSWLALNRDRLVKG